MVAIKTATFSIAGFDPTTKELGIAVHSKFLAAGAIVPHVETGVGAVATQALANPSYGPQGLKLLRQGKTPEETIKILTQADENSEHRQVGIVDAQGRSATYTGSKCLEWAGGIAGENFAAQGNILVCQKTVEAMADSFCSTTGALSDRLMAALKGADNAGGDRRGKQAAALLVYKEKGGYGGQNKYIDLRVDDDPEPVDKLQEILEIFYLYFAQREVPMIPLEGNIVKEIKELLGKKGFFSGKIDSAYTDELENSLQTFYHQENFEERIPEKKLIPEDILNYLRHRA